MLVLVLQRFGLWVALLRNPAAGELGAVGRHW
jgi:hypothetical protein